MTKPPTVVWDALAFAGATLVVGGLWLIWPPLAMILGGSATVAAAFWGASKWGS